MVLCFLSLFCCPLVYSERLFLFNLALLFVSCLAASFFWRRRAITSLPYLVFEKNYFFSFFERHCCSSSDFRRRALLWHWGLTHSCSSIFSCNFSFKVSMASIALPVIYWPKCLILFGLAKSTMDLWAAFTDKLQPFVFFISLYAPGPRACIYITILIDESIPAVLSPCYVCG